MKEALGVTFLALGVVAAAVSALSAVGFAASFIWVVVDPGGDWSHGGDFGRPHFLLSFVMTLAIGALAAGLILAARRLLARK
jgi:hypothetical protein